jgi:hypothetical protein
MKLSYFKIDIDTALEKMFSYLKLSELEATAIQKICKEY